MCRGRGEWTRGLTELQAWLGSPGWSCWSASPTAKKKAGSPRMVSDGPVQGTPFPNHLGPWGLLSEDPEAPGGLSTGTREAGGRCWLLFMIEACGSLKGPAGGIQASGPTATPCAARGSGALDPKQNSSLRPELPGDAEAMKAPTSWVPGMPRPETRVQGIPAGRMDCETLARDPWPLGSVSCWLLCWGPSLRSSDLRAWEPAGEEGA